MHLAGTLVADVEFSDLQRLVRDGVPETRVLEYKENLPGDTDSQKKKFLRDVSALANTAGGAIIYGVEEERDEDGKSTGVPSALPGLPGVENFDEEGRRYEQMIRDGLQPALTGVEVRFVEGENAPLMVVGTPRSLLGPHAVWYKSDGKFYRRAGRGVYQVEVSELRRLFLEAESWQRQIERWRKERIRAIREGEIGPQLKSPDGIWIQILPLGRLDQRINIVGHEAEMLRPAGGARFWGRHLLEGFVIPDDHAATSYTFFFYNGGAEGFLGLANLLVNDSGLLASSLAERELMKYASGFFSWIETVELDPPFAIILSIAGAKDTGLATAGIPRGLPKKFDRDEIFLPAVVLDTIQPDVEEVMHPVLDMMWQACGFEGSPNYDEEGNWTV